MDDGEGDFLALKILVESARTDPRNVAHYVLKAYWLGQGAFPIDKILAPPDPDLAGPMLRLILPD
jgi:hypothetical protein